MHKEIQFYTKILTLFVFFLAPFFYFLISKRRATSGDIKKILIVPQLTRIGDIVCSTSVFSALKKTYPQSKISVLISVQASGIIKNNTDIDEIIEIEEYQRAFTGLIKRLRKENFDVGVSLSGTSLSSLLFFYGLIPIRVKLTRRPRPIGELLTDVLNTCTKRYKHGTYIPAFYMELLKCVGVKEGSLEKRVYTTREGDEKAQTFLAKSRIPKDRMIIGMSISAGYNKLKEWGVLKYAELCTLIHKKHKVTFVVVGTKREDRRHETSVV